MKFVPGVSDKNGRFVPGQIIDTKSGPTFIPGQVCYTGEKNLKFVVAFKFISKSFNIKQRSMARDSFPVS
jgi:hypothetical protein